MEPGGFHGDLAFLSVAQETVVVRWELPECDGEMNNRLINCRPYPSPKANSSVPEKQLATRLRGMTTPSDVSLEDLPVVPHRLDGVEDVDRESAGHEKEIGLWIVNDRGDKLFGRSINHPVQSSVIRVVAGDGFVA